MKMHRKVAQMICSEQLTPKQLPPLWHKILDASFLRLLTTHSVTSDDDHFDWNVMTPSRSFQVRLNISLHSKNQFHHLSSIFKNIRVCFIFRFFEANFCHFLLQNFQLRAAEKKFCRRQKLKILLMLNFSLASVSLIFFLAVGGDLIFTWSWVQILADGLIYKGKILF